MSHLPIQTRNSIHALQDFENLGVFTVDANFICSDWNAGMEKITGVSRKDIEHQNLISKFPELLTSSHATYVKEAFNNKRNYIKGTLLFPFSKSKHLFDVSYIPQTDGNHKEACTIIIDLHPIHNSTFLELEKNELRYKTLSHNSDIGVWQVTPEGFTHYINPAMCKILGIDAIDELKGKPFRTFFNQSSLDKIVSDYQTRPSTPSPTYETEIIRKNGELRNILIQGSPLFSKDGRLEGMIGTFLDVTDQKNSEIELKKSEERFRFIFKKTLTPSGIARNGILLLANDQLVKLFKYDSPNEIAGISTLKLIHPKHHDAILQHIKLKDEGKHVPTYYEMTGIKKDGTEFPFQIEVGYMELPDGIATVLGFKDISEQKDAENALKASEAKFRSIFESSMIGINFTNSERQIVDANQKFLDMTLYTKEDLAKGMHWNMVSAPEFRDLDNDAAKEYRQNGVLAPFEKELIKKDGTRVPVFVAAARIQASVNLAVCFIVDISDLKQSQEETNKITHELRTFLYMASHDLKGPLASVIGLTNIARNEIEDVKAIEYINMIQECTLKLDRSLMNFLKIIKIKNNTVELVPINFDELVKEMLSGLMHQATFAEAEFTISNSLKSTFYSEPDLLKSIIQNLVENSVKYKTRLRRPEVKISIWENQDAITISVDDNGRGIDEAIKDKIFDIFYRGDIASKGSGLGLYIVKNAVEKLRGTIDVENKTEGGSIFTVTFPKKK